MDGAPEEKNKAAEVKTGLPLTANGRVIRPEWLVRFKNDATTHLTEISRIMILLPPQLAQTSTKEETEAEQKNLHELFRRAHSMKGAAQMVGLKEIGEKARQLEELLKQAYLEPTKFGTLQRESVRQRIQELQTLIDTQLTEA